MWNKDELSKMLEEDFHWIWHIVDEFDDDLQDSTEFWHNFKREFDDRLRKWDEVFEELIG